LGEQVNTCQLCEIETETDFIDGIETCFDCQNLTLDLEDIEPEEEKED